MPALTTRRLVSILRKVPEKRFRIMELAPGLIDENGKVDIEKTLAAQGELNLAIQEVQTYVRAVRAAGNGLGTIGGKDISMTDLLGDEDGEVGTEE